MQDAGSSCLILDASSANTVSRDVVQRPFHCFMQTSVSVQLFLKTIVVLCNALTIFQLANNTFGVISKYCGKDYALDFLVKACSESMIVTTCEYTYLAFFVIWSDLINYIEYK